MSSYFEYNGQRSDNFGIKIYNELSLAPAVRDVQTINVLGRDGELTIDNKRFKTIEKTIKFDVVPDKNLITGSGDGKPLRDLALLIDDWLTVPGYHNWKWSMYPDYLYKATIIDPYSIADTIRRKGKGVIKVRFHPIMYFLNSLTEIEVLNNQTIVNNGNVPALPLIRLQYLAAATNLEVKNNNKAWFTIRDFNTNLFVDSEAMQVRTSTATANNKLVVNSPLYPQLAIGNNKITFDNTKVKIFITTKIGRKAI